jgi:hypothetical protein
VSSVTLSLLALSEEGVDMVQVPGSRPRRALAVLCAAATKGGSFMVSDEFERLAVSRAGRLSRRFDGETATCRSGPVTFGARR